MLEQVLAHLRNWFVSDIYRGEFTITEGSITLPSLLDGQYFRIIGSTLNDGVYRNGDKADLKDETFRGVVWALAVPPALLRLVERIEEWEKKYAGAENSPYTSESFGGYSYTKNAAASSWQGAFRAELNEWRKI